MSRFPGVRWLFAGLLTLSAFNTSVLALPPVALEPGAAPPPSKDAPPPKEAPPQKKPPKEPAKDVPPPVIVDTILQQEVHQIDLGSALRLAGVQNPEILLAQARVTEADALRQFAAAQFLPTINLGTNLDLHNGPLQQSNGNILKVNRGSLYLGLGSNAIAAGSVNIPGLVWAGNPALTIYDTLIARQVVRQREFNNAAVRNEMLLRVTSAYLDLLAAEGMRAIAVQTRDEANEVARVTANYARTGEGRAADADRAAATVEERNAEVLQAENDVLTASARLCQLLNLDPSIRLHAIDGWVVPTPIVPDPVPLAELLTIALTRRPELGEAQADIRAALLRLQEAKVLPFSPNLVLGYSAGVFGGGSNLVSQGIPQADGSVLQKPRFGSFGDRQDIDAVVYWSVQNLGLGNLARIRLEQAHTRMSNYRRLEVLNQVRAEVATAYARTHSRYAQIGTAERALQRSSAGFKEDLNRTKNREGLPIEVLDSLRLLGRSRSSYLQAIIEYNRAQFQLYVALGQPPANCLARPIPASLVPPPADAHPADSCPAVTPCVTPPHSH